MLKFIEGYASEENVTVWRDLLVNLSGLSTVLLNTNYHHEFQAFVRRLLKPISKKLGWDAVQGESSLQSMCRATVLKALGVNGDPETIAEAKKRFEAHLNGTLIPADLRPAVRIQISLKYQSYIEFTNFRYTHLFCTTLTRLCLTNSSSCTTKPTCKRRE